MVDVKVLVAEQSISIRKMLSFVLKKVGFEVAEAETGDETESKALEFKPSLIVAGLNMPALDGAELIRSLRMHPRLSRVPILLLSGESPDRVKMGLKAGATGWVEDSVSPGELISAIRRILD